MIIPHPLPRLSGEPLKKAFWKDIWRSVIRGRRRFIAIAVITALGVTVLTGINAACQDVYRAADQFYDEQNLFDVRIQSTLGLTNNDVNALSKVSGIKQAEGCYTEIVSTDVEGAAEDAEVTILNGEGMNAPYLQDGRLPEKSGEVAVTKAFLDETGKNIGDKVNIVEKFEEEADDTKSTMASDDVDASDSAVNWDTDVEIEEDVEKPTFPITEFTITGSVISPTNISNNEMTFRSNTTTNYILFILPEDAENEVWSEVALTIEGLDKMNCYSEEYNAAVEEVIDRIEAGIKEQREQARYNEIIADGLSKISEAQKLMDDKFADAERQFADAWAELEDNKKQLTDGEATLTAEEKSALTQLAEARTQLENGKAQLVASEVQLSDGQKEIDKRSQDLAAGKQALAEGKKQAETGFAQAEKRFAEKQAELDTSGQALNTAVKELKVPFGEDWPETEWKALVDAAADKTVELLSENPDGDIDIKAVIDATLAEQNALSAAMLPIIISWHNPDIDPSEFLARAVQTGIGLGIHDGGQLVLESQRSKYEIEKAQTIAKLNASQRELEAGEEKLAAAQKEIDSGRSQLKSGWVELRTGESELNAREKDAIAQMAAAWQELVTNKQKLADGERELKDNEQQYAEKKAEAEQKINDAKKELDDLDMTKWYVQDRSSVDSYSGLDSDMSSIEAVGRAFPVIFLIVAVLISLTTMTRMVEEDRSLIGTYKALGFIEGAISAKYLLYATTACILGGVLGNLCGFVFLPKFLISIVYRMYILPNVVLCYDAFSGLSGIVLFLFFSVAATALTCHKELIQMPAILMRPKSPRAGSRILLEKIPFVWNHLSFLNKVTSRNIFRYKKRMLMTILGIMGCTALVLAGFAIKDSVTDLVPKQYDQTYTYDLMAVTDTKDFNDWRQTVIDGDPAIADYVSLYTTSYQVIGADGKSESVQLMVLPEGEDISDYIKIRNLADEIVSVSDAGILITQNAAELLGLSAGDTVTLQSMELTEGDAKVTDIVKNYLGNNVYMSQSLYESLFEEYETNAILAHLTDRAGDQADYAKTLLKNDKVISASSTEALRGDFSSNFTLLNSVVYILIILAAGLAFAVLFTLANTNISERSREIATIKVLGFFDREVHAYINKETLLLTLIGIVLGLPFGRFVSEQLTAALKMPSLYFAVYVSPWSYVYAAVISFSFALIVNVITNRSLDRVDMVEALKSVE